MNSTPNPSLRTRIVRKAAKGFWIVTLLLLAITIWLFYSYSSNDSDASNAAGFIGVITSVMTLVAGITALTFSLITKGSKHLDSALAEKPQLQSRTVVLDETDYQNK